MAVRAALNPFHCLDRNWEYMSTGDDKICRTGLQWRFNRRCHLL